MEFWMTDKKIKRTSTQLTTTTTSLSSVVVTTTTKTTAKAAASAAASSQSTSSASQSTSTPKRPKRQPKTIVQKINSLSNITPLRCLPAVDLSLLHLPWTRLSEHCVQYTRQNATPSIPPCCQFRLQAEQVLLKSRLRETELTKRSREVLTQSQNIEEWTRWALRIVKNKPLELVSLLTRTLVPEVNPASDHQQLQLLQNNTKNTRIKKRKIQHAQLTGSSVLSLCPPTADASAETAVVIASTTASNLPEGRSAKRKRSAARPRTVRSPRFAKLATKFKQQQQKHQLQQLPRN